MEEENEVGRERRGRELKIKSRNGEEIERAKT